MNQKIDNRTTSGFLAIVSPFFQVLTFQCVSLLWKFNKGRKLSSKIVSYFNTEKYGNMTVKCIALYRFSVYFEATEASKVCEIVAASYKDAVGTSLWIISWPLPLETLIKIQNQGIINEGRSLPWKSMCLLVKNSTKSDFFIWGRFQRLLLLRKYYYFLKLTQSIR